jgi:hypothetical protein
LACGVCAGAAPISLPNIYVHDPCVASNTFQEHRDDTFSEWKNSTTYQNGLGSTPQSSNPFDYQLEYSPTHSNLTSSSGFASRPDINYHSGSLPVDFDPFQNPVSFQSVGRTNHSFDSSKETYFSPLETSLPQSQQFAFEPINTYGTVSHSYTPAVYSNPIPQVDDHVHLQNALGNFTFESSPSLYTVIPSVTVQSPSTQLPDSIVFDSDPSHPDPGTPTPLDDSQSPSQNLSSTDEIRCVWPSCNKVFPSVHTYKCVISSLVLTPTNMAQSAFKESHKTFSVSILFSQT